MASKVKNMVRVLAIRLFRHGSLCIKPKSEYLLPEQVAQMYEKAGMCKILHVPENKQEKTSPVEEQEKIPPVEEQEK